MTGRPHSNYLVDVSEEQMREYWPGYVYVFRARGRAHDVAYAVRAFGNYDLALAEDESDPNWW